MTEVERIEWQWKNKDVHDADFFCFARLAGTYGLFVDVGANRGQSAASIRVVWPESEIVSFEPNPLVAPALSHIAAILGRMRVHNVALGAAEGEVTLLLPWVDGAPFLEQGTLTPEQFDRPWVMEGLLRHGQHVTTTEMRVNVRRLDSFDLDPVVIKVDAEGSELAVLQGAEQTLRDHRPVLMVENNDWHRVTPFLSALGYSCFRYLPEDGRLVPFFGETTNAFYLNGSAPASGRPSWVSRAPS